MQLLLHIGQPGMAKEIEEWDVPRFPVNGHMIKEHAKDISRLQIIDCFTQLIQYFLNFRWKATWNARSRAEGVVD